jgi:hypothetical protein
MNKKTYLIFITFVIVVGIYLISIPVGGFVAGHDALTGQIVVFLSVLSGMVLFYITEVLQKKYS